MVVAAAVLEGFVCSANSRNLSRRFITRPEPKAGSGVWCRIPDFGRRWKRVGFFPKAEHISQADPVEPFQIEGYCIGNGRRDSMPIELQNRNSDQELLIRVDRLELEVSGDLKRRVQGRIRHAGNVHALLEHDPLRECSYPENHEGACTVGECWLALNHTGGYGGAIRRLIAAIIEP